MKVSDRRKFEKANFDEFESALNNKNDLVHCPSITLFESIPTEVRSFYEDEKSGLIKVVKFRTGAMDRKRSFEKVVISVMVGKNVKKFLTFVEDEPDFQGGPIPSKYLIPKKINLMVYTLFQVHTLKFNRKDYDTLSLFYLNRGYYNELSFRVLERCHEIASARPNDSSTMRTFTDFVSGAPIVRSLQKSTIRKYGYNLAPYMFLLLHVDELSIFSAYQASLPGEKKVDTERLKRDLCPRKPIEIKYFSQICNDMMNKKDRLGDILHIILRACALNFGAGPRGGAGDEEDRSITNEEPIIPSVDEHGLKVCKLRSPNTPRRLRKTLDAVKALLVSSCACTARDLDIFDDNNGVAMWKWIKILYHEVAQETTLKDSYRITLVPSSDGISLLAFAGPQRNVYVDDTTRRIQLYTDYNKNGSSEPRLKTLDGLTSDYVFYFVTVLRQMQICALGNSYDAFNHDPWMDVVGFEDPNQVTNRDISRIVLYSYMFLNTAKGCLVEYATFRQYMRELPKNAPQKLNFREMRQGLIALGRHCVGSRFETDLYESATSELMANHSVQTGRNIYGVDSFSLTSVSGTTATLLQERASERWIQWLGLESDYHCSFSSTRNAEDVVAGEAASSNHHQKISRVTRKRPREPKSTNDILVAGQKLFGSSFEFRDLHQLRLCYEIYMADTPSVAVQAPPGYGKTELFHLPLIALASKGDVEYVSFLFVPYTVLLANCMIRLGRRGCLNVAPVRNFIEEGYDGVTDLYVGIYDDLASTNFTDRIAAWENIVECTFRTNNVKLGYLIVDEFHNFETEVYRQSQFGGITNLDFDAFEKAIFLSGTAPEAVADAALQRIGLTGLAKKSMDINELKRSEDLSRGLSSYPTRMFNLIKEKSEVPLGHVHKIRKKVESQPEEALKLLLALFESEPESKAIVVASTTNEVEELACSWRKYFRVVWIHGKLGAAEKVSRTKEFVTDGSMQVLIGTKLVTEGIDIKQLMMVIMLDNRLNIIELIQGVGRLRDGGLCYLLSRKNSWAARNRKGELPPIKEGCITEQVREFYGLESKKGKKGQHVGCCGSRTDLSADTVELIERMDRLAEKQATASMSIVALPSSFQESNSSDRYRKYCSSDEDSNTCIHGSANASTNASTNAITTASTNVRTNATTNASTNATTNASTNASTNATTNASTNATTNSSTNATTTASTNVRTSATTTASINVRTSATTTESTNSSTNATTTESTNSSTNATTTESTNSNTSATTTASINVRTSATTTESTNSSTSATTTASINVRTSATTTKSINSSTNATTTESTNSNTNATTTESTNSSTNATTTESTNSSTNATTTESTNSNTSAATTESTNSNTSATTTESTNASAKEDANKDGNAEDNRFHPVTDINKESYKRKGSQMVLLERKKLKAQFPNTSENMNVLQFLGFRSDEIKHLFLYGIDIYFCPEGVFTQYGLCKGCQKMFELCVCWAGQKVSYRRIAWEALAVERMLRNDEEYKEYLEDIEPYHGDPVGYLKYFSVKRREIYSQIQRNYAWYLAITRRRETISVLDSTRGKQGSQVFRMSGRQIKELYFKVWSNLRESKTEVLQYFLNWDEKKCQEEWEAKDDTVVVEALEKGGVFQRLRSMTSAGLQGPQYVKLQFSRHHRQLRSRYELSLGMHLRDQIALGVTPSKVPHWTAFLSMLIGLFYNKTFRQKLEYLLEQISEVWLLPHWLDLANVEVLAADDTRVPLYMLMVAVHKELDSDDVPDGRFDILLCRDSSREVGE
ncbi:Y' element ATP-dependent helicase [Saccharomyces cerevisiae S288C]|uniref:Y' element ATP-dependent helicase YJL225C n=1 Tax=Saccharomyces cerevisiae (strain ATCC 204508 / S288c) TaxID=559292 RepID=YJW5_YEAST|nr:Y' element ATP-dependent helicase [Saccharomyces cerevisiae S288C]P40889.2 RecName: Full=Y' element ATP-dependent helicase YJL225C [Saccharomyces cerevisiae S288C]KAF6740656.1 Y' element ATP-dependent helicase [Saccharomyces cerevisiae]KAF6740670.1 Y' element ATP-dependent helicase [Saccharomyces cerevisiae]KAG2506219.1 Y' element ATP-dependent helicase [Saccharomyces cerevisiae]KAG2514685.1 Y' element ATP-dependent helicase [Saccharomyces cerevisiae]KAG2515112.1 Y' element ATP-dependent h|eukprot:NP_012311.1 Y' element ATP-dependent helicase [Saccharomyces cerevisiae S288C]